MRCSNAADPRAQDTDSRSRAPACSKSRLIDLKQGGGGIGALKVAAEANELPALAMNHGCVADALEQMNAIDDGGERIVDAGAELGLRIRRVHLVKEAVEPLPLLGGDFFADLAGVFAGAVDAESNRGGANAVEDQLAGHRVDALRSTPSQRACQVCQQAPPALFTLTPPVSSMRLMVTSS